MQYKDAVADFQKASLQLESDIYKMAIVSSPETTATATDTFSKALTKW